MKRIISAFLVFCIFFLVGCSPSGNNDQNTHTSVSKDVQEADTVVSATDVSVTTVPVQLAPQEIYSAFLSKLCDKLRNIIVDDTHLDGFSERPGMIGIGEIAVQGGLDMLQKLGYTLRDLNGDGTQELIICQVDKLVQDSCKGTRILCAFTVSDNEEVLLFEGSSRNRYYLLLDGTIFNEGSNGAASNGFGVFGFEEGSTTISCIDFYFSSLNTEQQLQYFHNQSGHWDISASEVFDGDEEDFAAMQSEYASDIESLDLAVLETFEG